jgi:hypothetical protein
MRRLAEWVVISAAKVSHLLFHVIFNPEGLSSKHVADHYR